MSGFLPARLAALASVMFACNAVVFYVLGSGYAVVAALAASVGCAELAHWQAERARAGNRLDRVRRIAAFRQIACSALTTDTLSHPLAWDGLLTPPNLRAAPTASERDA